MFRALQILVGLLLALAGLMVIPAIAGLINGWDRFVDLALTFLRFAGAVVALVATIGGVALGIAIIINAVAGD